MSIYVRVSREEMKRIRALAKDRKQKREEKAAVLWPARKKAKPSGSLYKWWAERLDALWGRVVRARDKYLFGDVCRIGKAKNCTGKAEVGYHLISKARGKMIRWHLEAGVAACGACNDGERLNRVLYDGYHKEIFGEKFIEELKELAKKSLKIGPPEMKEMAEKFLQLEKVYIQLQMTKNFIMRGRMNEHHL